MSKYLFEKAASEKLTLEIDLSDRLPTSASVSSIVASATDQLDGSTVSSTLLASTAGTVNGNIISFIVQSGTAAHWYDVTALTTLDNADVLQESVVLKIKS